MRVPESAQGLLTRGSVRPVASHQENMGLVFGVFEALKDQKTSAFRKGPLMGTVGYNVSQSLKFSAGIIDYISYPKTWLCLVRNSCSKILMLDKVI
jgi:hypothetical protein